jgi:acetyl-CoA acetyltransferase
MARNPIKDQVAIVGVGSTGFTRHGGRTPASLATEAATTAILDAGLTARDIDGVVSTGEPGAPPPQQMAAMLGLTEVTHYPRSTSVVMFALIDAMNAVFSGSADTVLVYNPVLRLPWNSRSASQDPFRRHFSTGGASGIPESMSMAVAYTAWASRYLYEYGGTREDFGLVTVNARSNGTRNPLATLREPITMDDYLSARMIREPFCMLDMDIPTDGADAFVVTTTERARDLARPPVLIHAATTGTAAALAEDQLGDLAHHGQHVVAKSLQAKSDLWLSDTDVFLPYDGFTIITLGWIENLGWCGPGEAGAFLRQHWDQATNRVLINGRIPMNPHGGALAEGATRGSGYVREAVQQLRGEAADRQVAGAATALVTSGGFFFNSQGLVLRAG